MGKGGTLSNTENPLSDTKNRYNLSEDQQIIIEFQEQLKTSKAIIAVEGHYASPTQLTSYR